MKSIQQHILEHLQVYENDQSADAMSEMNKFFQNEMKKSIASSLVNTFSASSKKISGRKDGVDIWAGTKYHVFGDSIEDVKRYLSQATDRLKNIQSAIESEVAKYNGILEVKFKIVDESKIVEVFDREMIGRHWGSAEVPKLLFDITIAKNAKEHFVVENEITYSALTALSNVKIITTRHKETSNREVDAIVLHVYDDNASIYDVDKNDIYRIKKSQFKSISLVSILDVSKNNKCFKMLYDKFWTTCKVGDKITALSKRYRKSEQPRQYIIAYMNIDKIVLKNVDGPGSVTIDSTTKFHSLEKL